MLEHPATLESVSADLEKIHTRLTSNSARLWDIATKITVPIAVFIAGWLITIDRGQTSNGHRIDLVERTVSMQAGPDQEMKDNIAAIRTKTDDIVERLARVEAMVDK